jgi:hypothetical protein
MVRSQNIAHRKVTGLVLLDMQVQPGDEVKVAV